MLQFIAPIDVTGTLARPIAAFMLAALLVGCQRPVRLAGEPMQQVDFSGSWELNYQLSERIQENVEALRLMAITAARRRGDAWLSMPSLELVRLAESISRSTVLEIDQTGRQIEIQRQDDFPLTCTFGPVPSVEEDPLGSEYCGWDLHQLVFAFRLPDGLRVTHRLTLAPDRAKLNVATTVRTRGAGQQFTLNRVYTRFEQPQDEYECRMTVEGDKSCRRIADPEQAALLQ